MRSRSTRSRTEFTSKLATPEFGFVGRQMHFDVGGDDFYVDLLFFHVEQLRYVVIELKTGKSKPEYLCQFGFYVSLVDDRLRRSQLVETVGLLLVADKNDAVVRYSVVGQQTPIDVASYDLPAPSVQAALPTEAELTQALRDSAENAGTGPSGGSEEERTAG